MGYGIFHMCETPLVNALVGFTILTDLIRITSTIANSIYRAGDVVRNGKRAEFNQVGKLAEIDTL